MIRFDFISCVPELLGSPLSGSILGRAQKKGLLEVGIHDLHTYGTGKHGRIDDAPYGGGGGMVLQVEPIARCINALKSKRNYDEIIFLSPDGALLDQAMAVKLSNATALMLLCGHYQGIDERVRSLGLISQEVSIGDYVLTGGELPALVLCDTVVRLLPGVVGDGQSVLEDAFQEGMLAPPLYTRPANYMGAKVPEVLCSGHAKNITSWREEQKLIRTKARRPKLLSRDIKR